MLWFYGFSKWIHGKCLYNSYWKYRSDWWRREIYWDWIVLGDSNAAERANQARPIKEDASGKSLQAAARRQRRIEGLQLFEKTKLNRSIRKHCKFSSLSFSLVSVWSLQQNMILSRFYNIWLILWHSLHILWFILNLFRWDNYWLDSKIKLELSRVFLNVINFWRNAVEVSM